MAHAVGRPWYTAACVLVRTMAFRGVGGFDEGFFMYYEDVDFCIRLQRAGWRLTLEPRAVVHHRGGLAAAGRGADEAYRRSQLRFYRKHRPRWELRLMRQRLRRRFGGDAVDAWQSREAPR
jgi:GT2 family glycosyltransferase